MRPSFLPRLINTGFEDPVLFVPFSSLGRAVIFDLGDIHSLPARDALKITHAFVTHTHMDHFCGFDRLLRLFLERDKTLHLYGPAGFIDNVRGKLAGYTWNLVENSDTRFALHVTEVHAEGIRCQRYSCKQRFEPTDPVLEASFGGVVYRQKEFCVSAALLDHGTNSLAFALEEPFHINIIKAALAELGLVVGPWVSDFKRALFLNRDGEETFVIPARSDGGMARAFRLGDLAGRIARLTTGQKIAYIMDAGYSARNAQRMVDLCHGADHLFIEAAFLDRDREIAARKHHLTARQAGTIAARAEVEKLTVCHFSPRYEGQAGLLQAEAADAFEAARSKSPHRKTP